ncbi:hypothetical protein CW304_04325 [Bacillus sp. UFRGS-B20]|nr:hypothetical protein CW304_04325 [Bacillus sp. UFRGS-B20]
MKFSYNLHFLFRLFFFSKSTFRRYHTFLIGQPLNTYPYTVRSGSPKQVFKAFPFSTPVGYSVFNFLLQ